MKTCRLIRTMEICQHMILGSSLSSPPVEIHHILVITIHKINLESLDAHLRIMSAHLFHITVESPVAGP